MAIRVYGCRIGIRVSEPALLEPLRRALPPGSQPRAGSIIVDRLYSVAGSRRRRFVAYVDATPMGPSARLQEAVDAIEGDLRLYVARTARRRVFVHAGVVGWRGRAIVIPGSSFSGKSRLVAALLRAGASYLSDEYGVLDERGRVHPFPAPLSIRNGARPRRRPSAEDLGGVTERGPLPVGVVALTRFRRGAAWRPRPLTPGQAVLALMAHTVPARERPAEVLRTLRRAAAGALGLEGPRGEADQAADRLLSRLDLHIDEGSCQ